LKNIISALFGAGVVIRGSTVGNGGELLVEANLYGNSFVLGGAALIVMLTLRARKVS